MNENKIKQTFEKLQLDDVFYNQIIEHIKVGNTSLIQSKVLETMEVDDEWIRVIESLFFSIEQIVKKPKSSIVDERELVNVEKAKRIDSETVRHLSENTQYIRKFDQETGFVQPSKVLVKEMQEDLYIYENRFVVALIDRLCSFIEQRYTAIKEQVDTYDTTDLKMRSKFNTEKGDVAYELNLRVRNEPANKVLLQKNFELLNKIEIIRKRLLILRGTEFYKKISVLKPITPPIMKTNIINLHTDYNNCYKLFVYISSYTMVGFSVEVAEKRLPIDTNYYDDLTMLVALSLKTMIDNNAIREPKYRSIKFRKRSKKRYRELRRIQYEPSFSGGSREKSDDEINQYYFDEIKRLLQKKDNIKKSDLLRVSEFNASFRRLFRSLNNLNNEMYQEIVSQSNIKEPVRRLNTLQKARLELRRQEEFYKKLSLISRLKMQELERTLYRENTQKIKLERLRFKYETELAKGSKKKVKKYKRKTSRLEVERRRLEAIFARAEQDQSKRMAKELERQEAIVEKEEQRLKNLEIAREKKREIQELAKEIIRRREEEN